MPRGAGGMPTKLEHAQQPVVARHGALALVDLDFNRRLAVRRRREDLALAGRNRRVALNQLGEHAAQRFDAERQRRHVEQQHVLHFAAQHAALHRRAHRHHFIGIHALVRLFAEQVADHLLHLRNTRRTAYENYLVDVLRRHARVLQSLLARPNRALQNIVHHLLETRASA